MNRHDSMRMKGLLEDRGWEEVDDPLRAHVAIINSCTIRAKAEDKAYSETGRILSARGERKWPMVVLAGCVATQDGKRIWRRLPRVDRILGPSQVGELPRLLEPHLGRSESLCLGEPAEPLRCFVPLPDSLAPGLQAYVTITKGCDNWCSYCIVPRVRGPELSRPFQDIVDEVERLVDRGVREITLLGQNVNSYRAGRIGFVAILERLARVEGLWRVRFTTSHPKDFDPDLARAFRDLPNLCEQLHFPLQSGSDRVLAAMRRRYSRERYLDAVERVRRYAPEVGLSTDIIVGFPGEEEEDFQATLAVLREVEYDGIFSFCYSPRVGTMAATLEDRLPQEVKKERLQTVQAIQEEIGSQRRQRLIGQTMEVLVEGVSSRSTAAHPQYVGRTRSGYIVNFTDSRDRRGELVDVQIVEALRNSLRGRTSS